MKSRQPIICLSSSSYIAFLFYGLVIFHTTATVAASNGGNETDYQALLSFKSMIKDPNEALSSWNTSVHFCDWSGVSCGKRHKRVIIIRLMSRGLEGSLSPYVGNLSFLRELFLSNNSFQGTIPRELGRLSKLRLLSLEENKFSGVIPTNISGCFNLETLLLGHNKLVGIIPYEISFLLKLRVVVVEYNNLTGGIPPFLGNITSMEVFSALNTPLGGSIPDTLGHLKSLRVFRFGGCNLYGTIPSSLYNLSFLTVFSLPNNKLTGSLPPNIGAMLPHLVSLQVRINQLTGAIPPSISNCSKLGLLEMSENSFSGKLTIEFYKLTELYTISLGNNNLHGEGEANDMKFIDSLKNCSKLEILEVANSTLEGVLPISIGNLSDQLKYINIARNRLYGDIPLSIGNLVGLATLHLSYNRFTGKIPYTIGKLRKLQVFSLMENQLSGPIPDDIGNLSLLTKFSLRSNRLEGHIPSSLSLVNFQQLLGLDLSNNKLTGMIPIQILGLSSLSIVLDLSHNNLFGSLPPEVGNLKMLGYLDLSYNNLSDNIPSSLGGCTSLSFLSLKSNLFQGMLPPSLGFLTALLELDLSENNLTGQIPQFLERFSFQNLNLSFNDFEGEVPVKGVFTNTSGFSILGNSRLCGGSTQLGLPKCKEKKKDKKRLPVFVIVILSAAAVFAILCVVYVWCKKKSNGQPFQSTRKEPFLKVSYGQLLKATNSFSEANLIGKGGFSSVYKGTLDNDDNFVAIKVLHLQKHGAHKSFLAECEAWRSIRHRNLLKIITACSSVDFQGNDFKALVYEFMPRGSLHDLLHSSASTTKLNILQRINILMDIACALDYLHNRCETTVVHGDLKPSNILLDDDMVAHVGDFGLSRFLGTDSYQNSTNGIKGTIGYAPPEYGLGSEMSSSGDVYSFGILLLEVMTGKKPTDDIFNEGFSLHKFAYAALPDHVTNVVDVDALALQSTVEKQNKMDECLAAVVKIGVSCSMESPPQRMNIENVVYELQHILDALQNI